MTTLSSGRAATRLTTVAALLLVMLASIVGPATPVALASFTPNPYLQDFNTLASSGTSNTWTDNSTIPLWYSSRTLYLISTGTNNAGGLYSFGSTADRAIGSLASGSVTPVVYGVALSNTTGATVTQLDISYTGEQWRDGGAASGSLAQTIDFQYQIGATGVTAPAGWVDVNELDFTSPSIGRTTATALDGNAAANRTARSASITGLSLAPDQTIWLRWVDADSPGSDHGLAVDDLSVMAVGGPVLPTITVTATDASAAEAAQDPGTFRVSRSGDTTAALTVNVTAAGTATAPDDYTPVLPTAVEIAAGATFTDLTITPVDDNASEGDETVSLTATAGAAYTVGAPAGATVTIADNDAAPVACPAGPTITRIAAIQGTGASAALTGAHTVEGVVTQLAPGLSGFYIQEEVADQDADPATSEGIFVFAGASFADLPAGLAAGDVVRVSGTVGEFGGTSSNPTLQTQLSGTLTVTDCGVTAAVTPVDINFPLASAGDFERYEGMLVRFPQTLTINEYFNFDRFGEVVLSYADGTPGLGGRGRFYTPTNIVAPGAAATTLSAEYAKRRITLDDGRTASNPTPAIHPNGQPFTLLNRFRGGDTLAGVVGNIDNTFGLYRVQPTDRGTYAATNSRPASPAPLTGSVRVAALNTLNFFLTLDPPASSSSGPCGGNQNLECRGANTDQPDEFTRQRTKLLEALKGINADVQGLNELENTPGVDPLGDPTRGIVPGLNAALGAGTYDYINTGVIGTDAIRVGLIYKPAVVTPVGPFAILDSTDDSRFLDTKNRPVLAQTFRENATGAIFIVAVAHFKSKGSDCNDVGDPDAGDGQGNCNGTRTLAAQALVDWLDATFTDKDFLIVGDLNSYAKEDPITAILHGPDGVAGSADDYTNLIQRFVGDDAYSYVFDGQLGYLDHALASAGLNAQATGANEWHINADEPDILDYDTSFKLAAEDALYEPNAYRTSDHDPVIVGLTLTPPPAGVAPAITTQPQSQTINAGQTATLSVVATGSAPLSYQWYTGTSGDTSSPIAGATADSYTTPALSAGTYTYWVRVSNGVAPDANSTTATVTVNEPGVAPAITTQPQSQTINAGQTAALSVVATGTAPLSYQWYQGTSGTTTTPVGTNSASFTTPALNTTTSYWVRVSNNAGSADSNTATITVNSAPPADLVISQVYGGGGNAGATYTHDYIELYNRSSSPVSLAGMSLQYASATGTGNFGANTGQLTELPSVVIQPGHYYLVQQVSSGAVGAALPTADLVDPTPINLSGAAGKVALVNGTTSLGCNGGSAACSSAQLALIVDLVGYGNANFFEGAGAAPGLTNTTAALRAGGGTTDTNNNNLDFAAGAPNPRNSSFGDTAPVITTHPQGQAVAAGQTATLSVVATGTAPLSYQWYAGLSGDTSSLIGGATAASYTTPALSAGTYNYWVRVSNAVGFADSNTATITAEIAICDQPFTPIYSIQGTGTSAAITGNVTVEGVVVGDFEGANAVGINGFYLQDETGDGDAATSDGIFVFTGTVPGTNTVAAGERVRVTGFARERFNETTLNGSNSNTVAVPATSIVKCGTASVAATSVALPVASTTFLERYEGMLINLPQSLVISEYFNYDQFGEYVLALPIGSEARPYTPTAVEEPGSAGYAARLDLNLRSRILIDDGLAASNPATGNTHPNGLPYSLSNSFRGGDTVTGLTGVLGFGFNNYRVQPTAYGTYAAVNPRPAAPAPVGGNLRAGAFNTLNYFLTADYPTGNALDNKCGPLQNVECRGWDFDQPTELTRQRDKLLAALKGIDADILGLNELENTAGVEPLADIVTGLNADLGAGTYAYINTGTIGTDAIKVGLIYKPGAVTPVGPFETLTATDDPRFRDTLNRPVLAQTFEEKATGAIFTVAVVHLKSKGSDCNAVSDPDAGDGQGNCNGTRTLAAQALVDWLDATFSDKDFLIVGDLNSYAREDPIDAALAGPDGVTGSADDYTNLIQRFIGAEAYSYVFDGQSGYLDHALASASLNAQVTGATEWHINADEVDLIDYDTTFKSTVQDGYYAPDAYRTSDHDPVIVGLDLNAAPVAVDDTFSTSEDVAVSGNVLANDTDGNDDVLTAALVGSPAGVAFAADGTFTFTPPANASGTFTFEYTVSDGSLSDTGLVTITVVAVNDLPVATNDTATTAEDTSVTVAVLANDSDLDGDTLTVTAVNGATNGTAQIVSGGVIFTPATNYSGVASFSYTVADGNGGTATASVSITVTPVNDPPTIAALPAIGVCAANGVSGAFQVATSDIEPGALTITTSSSNPLVTALVTGSTVTFSVAGSSQAQSGTVTITVTDAGGATAAITASVWAGTGGGDTRTGGSGIDVIFGRDGVDTLRGGGGFDLLCGGQGEDQLFGDDGNDTLDGGQGADTLRGGADADRLFGGQGEDQLFGEDGNDTLTGGAARDSFDGGPGTDTVTDRASNEPQVNVP